MILNQKPGTFIFLGITIIALFLFSTSLSQLEFLPGQPFPFSRLVDSEAAAFPEGGGSGLAATPLAWWTMLLAAVFIMLIGLWIMVFILRPEARKYLLSRLVSYLVLLLLISSLIYTLQRPLSSIEGDDAADPQSVQFDQLLTSEEPLTPPMLVLDPPRWLVAAITLGLFTVILGVVWFVWIRRPRRREFPADLIAREAEQGVQAIRAGNNLKDAVMSCYLNMNRILSEQRHIQREETMTPREFENRLAETGLSDDHIRRLTRLFEGVRYGANPPTRQEEREAVACLSAIGEAYGQPS